MDGGPQCRLIGLDDETQVDLTSMVSPCSLTAPTPKLPLVLAHDASET